jgi:hypothetical protein
MSQTIYTTCNPIVEDCALFQNNGRTIPASAGVYWDGTNCWEVDLNGIVTAQGSCVTTTSTTTTTTTAGSSFYYNVDQHDCANSCAYVQSFVAVSSTALTVNRFYNIADGYVYKVISSTVAPDDGIDLTGAPSSTNCTIACTL